MNKGMVLIILGIVIIVGLFIVDTVAGKQVFGPPYVYDQGEQKAAEKSSTFYPERAQGWVRGYYNVDTILWGAGLPLSIILICLGIWQKGKTKSKVQ
jgi:hypothetical protein